MHDTDASDETAEQRRARSYAAAIERTGIDETMIDRLVRTFYDRVRLDPMLGPVFAAKIQDWEPHLQKIAAFWSSVMLMSGRYHGRPMPAHFRLPIDASHFDRWLALFEQTANDTCPPEAAAQFVERAHRIGESLELGIATVRGQMLAKGQRLDPLK